MTSRALLTAFLLLGCNETTPPAAGPETVANADPWAVPAAVTSLSLPRSTSNDAPRSATRVYIAGAGLFSGNPPVQIGSAPRSGGGFIAADHRGQNERDMWITPVATAMRGGAHRAGSTSVLFYADATTTLRAITEASYTAAQSGATKLELAVAGAGPVRAIPFAIETRASGGVAGALDASDVPPVDLAALAASSAGVNDSGGGLHLPSGDGQVSSNPEPTVDARGVAARVATPPSLGLTVLIVHDGVGIKATGGNVAPGCNDAGPGLAIPGRDMRALHACVIKLRAMLSGAGDEAITVGGAPDVTLQTLVDVIDSVRLDDNGKPLFAGVQLGVH